MKKLHSYSMYFRLLLFLLISTLSSRLLYGQCISCDGTTTNGLYPSAIGRYTQATGNYSFAGGIYSEANGAASFAFGNRVFAEGGSSVVLGQFVRVHTSSAMIFGVGFNIDNPLINSQTHSMMIGFGSTKPTLFVGPSIEVNSTGKIGIGNVTDPLHRLSYTSEQISTMMPVYCLRPPVVTKEVVF